MEPTIVLFKEKKLVGCSCKTNFIEDKTSMLWQSFMPHVKEINDKISSNLFSVKVYDVVYNFNQFNPSIYFTKWATTEVSAFNDVPVNMETLIIPDGLYAVFLHKGSNTDNSTFQYIFQTWLPNSPIYLLDSRPHFEILGEKYRNGDPTSEEEIYIPIRLKTPD